MAIDFLNSKKSIICFMRHGQTDWNIDGRMQGTEDIPLNEKGIAQAYESAKGFKDALEKTGIKWDKIISSPLGRAYTTAQIIADAIKHGKVESDIRVTERNFGVLSGYVYGDFFVEYEKSPEKAKTVETEEHLLNRTKEFIKDTVKEGEKVLIVAHGAIIRYLARNSQATNEMKKRVETEYVQNCSLVIYSYDGENMTLEGYNVPTSDLADFIINNSEKI